MIDVETEVFDTVYQAVYRLVPEGCVSGVYVPQPPAFPFVTLMETDNATYTRQRSTAVDEEYAVVTYEANVYANDKHECREVMDAIDTALVRLNFTRLSMAFTPNLADETIFRITARYRAAADTNKRFYRYR